MNYSLLFHTIWPPWDFDRPKKTTVTFPKNMMWIIARPNWILELGSITTKQQIEETRFDESNSFKQKKSLLADLNFSL